MCEYVLFLHAELLRLLYVCHSQLHAPFYLNLIDFGDTDVMDFNEHLENAFTALELVKDEKYKVHVKRIKEDLNSFIENTMIPCLLKLEIHIILR